MGLIGNGIRLNGNPGLYSGWSGAFTSDVATRLKTHSSVRPFWFGEATVDVVAAVEGTWTYGSTILDAQNKSASSSWAPTTSGNLTSGHVGILQIAFDNLATASGETSSITSVTDAAGNTWTKAKEHTYSAGAAGDGATISLWYCKATTTLSSGSAVTINFSGSVTAKVAHLLRFAISGGDVTVVGSATEAVAATDPGSLVVNPSSGTRQHLYYRAIALEIDGGAPLPTSGFITSGDTSTSGGAADSNIYGSGEWRIQTSDTSTSNPNYGAVDNASVFVAFDAGSPGSAVSIANKSGWPSGSVHPHCWVMPIKAGGLASRNEMFVGASLAASMAIGHNVTANMDTGVSMTASMGIVIPLTCSMTVDASLTADMSQAIALVCNMTAGADMTATVGQLLHLACSMGVSVSMTINTYQGIFMECEMETSASLAFPTAQENAAAVLAGVIEAGYDLRDVLALLAARDLGTCTGGPTTPAWKGLDGTTTRVTGTVDTNGNRSSITLTPG